MTLKIMPLSSARSTLM